MRHDNLAFHPVECPRCGGKCGFGEASPDFCDEDVESGDMLRAHGKCPKCGAGLTLTVEATMDFDVSAEEG